MLDPKTRPHGPHWAHALNAFAITFAGRFERATH